MVKSFESWLTQHVSDEEILKNVALRIIRKYATKPLSYESDDLPSMTIKDLTESLKLIGDGKVEIEEDDKATYSEFLEGTWKLHIRGHVWAPYFGRKSLFYSILLYDTNNCSKTYAGFGVSFTDCDTLLRILDENHPDIYFDDVTSFSKAIEELRPYMMDAIRKRGKK